VWAVNCVLGPGDLILIKLEPEQIRLPLADGAEGLVRPTKGRVCFLGEDWLEMSPAQGAARRGQIGRVFEDAGWISDLDVDENITLAQRHHTQRDEAEIQAEATKLARVFNLPGLPKGVVSSARRHDLQRAACIRAFLGSPVLLILERPTRGVFPDILPALLNTVQQTRRRGAAVLWTTTNEEIWQSKAIHPTTRCQMFGSRIHEVKETG
jgi:phospholipid/cholesterol/gamma-HCH transport system ATP-binding protein